MARLAGARREGQVVSDRPVVHPQELVTRTGECIAGGIEADVLPVLRPIFLASLALNCAAGALRSLTAEGFLAPELTMLQGDAQAWSTEGIDPVRVDCPVTVLACAALALLEGPEGERQRYRDTVGRAQQLILAECDQYGGLVVDE